MEVHPWNSWGHVPRRVLSQKGAEREPSKAGDSKAQRNGAQGIPKRREMELMKIMINGMYGIGALTGFPLTFPDEMDTAFDVGRQISSISGEVLSAECLLE